MKKILAIAAMLLTMFTANAQSNSCQEVKTFSIKPYVGLSTAMFMSKNENTDMRTGITAGVEGQYMFSEKFALSVGAAYQQQGGKIDMGNSLKMTNKFDYLNVPIMANFYVSKGLALKVGVQPGFLVNKKAELKNDVTGQSVSADYEDRFRNFDLAIPVGISYEFNNIVFDARVNVGTIGIFKSLDGWDVKNGTNAVGQLTVGYRF